MRDRQSGLAAPAFAAALFDRPLAQPLPLSNVPLRAVDLDTTADSPLVGRALHDVHAGRDLRVLALDGRWRPRDDLVIAPGMRLSVVGTRRRATRCSGRPLRRRPGERRRSPVG